MILTIIFLAVLFYVVKGQARTNQEMLSLSGSRSSKVVVRLDTVIKNVDKAHLIGQLQNGDWRLSKKQRNFEFGENLVQEGGSTLYKIQKDGNRIFLTKYF